MNPDLIEYIASVLAGMAVGVVIILSVKYFQRGDK